MKTSEILKAGRARIEDPDRWGQHTSIDKAGRRCAIGALCEDNHNLGYNALCYALGTHPFSGGGVSHYNDTHTHEEVLALFDKAIAMAEAEEGGGS